MDGRPSSRHRRRAASLRVVGPPTEERLLAALDRTFAEAARRAGPALVCGAGCARCCHGPFPITRLDAERLRRGLDLTERNDPGRAARIRARALEAVARLRADFPGDADEGRLSGGEPALNRFFAVHAARPCPVLDPDSGKCDLYDHRPVACRTYGPPLRHGDRKAPHCPLCFRGATAEEVERCRVEPDAAGLEQALLAAAGVRGGAEWETLIAFAVQT